MMRNQNQVCGVLALIAVGCLVAFGSAGDRIVTAAPGQIGQAGDPGTAIAIGGCNRCAWQHLTIRQQGVLAGAEVQLFPAGTSGVLYQLETNGGTYTLTDGPPADGNIIFNDVSAFWILKPIAGEQGVAFVNGLSLTPQGEIGDARIGVFYRLD